MKYLKLFEEYLIEKYLTSPHIDVDEDSDIYFHCSLASFDKFDNVSNNKSTTVFGNELQHRGNFITKESDVAIKRYGIRKDLNKSGFLYIVKLKTDNIFDLRKSDMEDVINYVGEDYVDYVEEGYVTNGLPTWDFYPLIDYAKDNGFDGIKLMEFESGTPSIEYESVFVFEPNNLEIIDKYDLSNFL